MNIKKIIKLILSLLITFLFLYYVFYKVGFSSVYELFVKVSPVSVFIAFILYLFSYIARTFRWSLTLDIKDFKKLFKLTVYNTFFNIILPFRTGEVSFFYILKKEGVHIVDSTMSFVVTRIFDGLSLLAIFTLSYFIFIGKELIGIILFFLIPFSFYLLIFVIKFIKHEKFKLYTDSKLKFTNLLQVYFLSIVTLIFKFSAFYFILPKEVNINIFQSILASSSADLTTVLPIHGIAGIGTYEAGYSGILILLNIPYNLSISLSILVHTFILLSSSILFLFTYIFSKFKNF